MIITDEHISQIRRMRTVHDSRDAAWLIFNVKIPCISTEGDVQKLYSTTLQGGIALSGNSDLDREIALTPRQILMTIDGMIEMIRIGGELSLLNAYHSVFVIETIKKHFDNIREVLEIDPAHKIPIEDLQDLEKLYNRLVKMALPFQLKEADRQVTEPGALLSIIDMMYPRDKVKEHLVDKASKPTKMVQSLYDIAGSSKIKWGDH